MPRVGHRAIELLSAGLSIGEVQDQLRVEENSALDVCAFVSTLADLNFVAAVNDQPLASGRLLTPTFPWLRPAHVKWTLHPLTGGVITALVLTAITTLIVNPTLIPRYSDLVWDRHGTVVILGNALIGWTIVLMHELAHLSTSRAAGVPGRMSFGTRLHFLVAQTDVTGVWASPRRTRLTVYLSGIAVNFAIAALGVLFQASMGHGGALSGLAAAIVAIAILGIPMQFLVFMRTDIYYVIQDLAGARDLYKDAASYLQNLLRRVMRPRRPFSSLASTEMLPPKEHRVVRIYSGVLLFGTAACLVFASTITLPAIIVVATRSLHEIASAEDAFRVFDAIVTLLMGLGVTTLWLRAWWRRHGHRARQVLRRARAPRKGGGGERNGADHYSEA